MIRIKLGENVKEFKITGEQTLLELFQMHGISEVHSPCGGNGTCKKCLVKVELNGDVKEVLACQEKACDGMTVLLEKEKEDTIATSGNCVIYDPDKADEGYAVACDIGTTTVVCHLLKLGSKRRLGTASAMNAQKSFGADVIARITACTNGSFDQLTSAIIGQINGLMKELCEKAKIELSEIKCLTIVGNTVMEHLFAHLSPETIGVAPFTPLSLFGDTHNAKELGLAFDGEVYMAPCVAGYVGGDITSDMLAILMDKSEDDILMIDIGTNGEMSLGNKDRMICCATAAGPAFEGAEITMGMSAKEGAISKVWLDESGDKPKICVSTIGGKESIGICGSGLVDAIALLVELEIIDESGLMIDEDEVDEAFAGQLVEEDDGMAFYLDERVKITQGDVRKIQLAKGAIAAGILTMVKEYGKPMSSIKRLILAGGFGSFLDQKSAATIGLIPKELLPVTVSVGNAAGEGAVSLAISSEARSAIEALTTKCEYIELSNSAAFNQFYMECMCFE